MKVWGVWGAHTVYVLRLFSGGKSEKYSQYNFGNALTLRRGLLFAKKKRATLTHYEQSKSS